MITSLDEAVRICALCLGDVANWTCWYDTTWYDIVLRLALTTSHRWRRLRLTLKEHGLVSMRVDWFYTTRVLGGDLFRPPHWGPPEVSDRVYWEVHGLMMAEHLSGELHRAFSPYHTRCVCW